MLGATCGHRSLVLTVVFFATCAACDAPEVIPGVMNVASVGYDDGAIALSSSDDPCDRSGALIPPSEGRVTTMFFFFGLGEKPVGPQAIPGDLDSDDGIIATFRVGSNNDTCDTDVFITDWEGSITLNQPAPDGSFFFAVDVESDSSGRSIDAGFTTNTRCETSVFELGNGCI